MSKAKKQKPNIIKQYNSKYFLFVDQQYILRTVIKWLVFNKSQFLQI